MVVKGSPDSINPAGFVVNHKDGNKANNELSNLEYVTTGENVRHAHRIGLFPRGSKFRCSKLTEAMVLEARKLAKQGEFATVLARRFGVTADTMREAIAGRTWKHVT